MTALLIDIGNTNLKWAIDTSDGFVFGGVCRSQSGSIESLLVNEWDDLKPDTVFMSCVSNETIKQQVFAASKSCWGIQAESIVTPAQGCGISNAYATPVNMGSDRWAAIVAAFNQLKGPVCVVDSGTAVTLDVVNSAGRHLGGLIIPGYGLMQECLQKGTRMAFVNERPSSNPIELGTSTEGCIHGGVSLAISSMVNTMFAKLQTELTGIRLILTGGDAEMLQGQLGCESSIDPHLVLKGLGFIHRSRVLVD